jgi:bifunctional DNA-binding transcriptional regulator/antitoxin component of YhaV-PrlF toxin-antitoxin module
MSAVNIQLRRKGILTLPVSLRGKYNLDENDVFTLEVLTVCGIDPHHVQR